MILKVNKHMQINIADDDELLDSLLSHIKPTIYRLKNNLNIERDIYFEAVEAYPELFSLIKESLGELEILVNKKIPDSEIALFTLHFLASLERNKNNDLWDKMDEAIKNLDIEWKHVKGHSGDKFNELCDTLAVHASNIIEN